MKIGVSSYSYVRLIRDGRLTLLGVIDKAAEMGFEAVEFTTLPPADGEDTLAVARRLSERAGELGLPIVNYAVGADFLSGSGGDLRAEIDRVKREVDVAKQLGAPRMRHDASRGFPAGVRGAASFDAALPRLIEGCREVTRYAEDQGVATTIENHGYFCQDSDRVEKLICGVDHANFGLLADIGNFICVDEHPGHAIGRLRPYIFHVHAKDFHLKPGTGVDPGEGWRSSRAGNYWRGAIIGHGDVPLAQCLNLLARTDYQGVVSIEFEGLEDPIEGIRIGRDNLLRMMNRNSPVG